MRASYASQAGEIAAWQADRLTEDGNEMGMLEPRYGVVRAKMKVEPGISNTVVVTLFFRVAAGSTEQFWRFSGDDSHLV